MVKLAQHAQPLAIHVQVIVSAKLVSQDMLYKAASAALVPQEAILRAKLAQHAQVIVQHVQAALFVRLARQGLVYKATNATPAL